MSRTIPRDISGPDRGLQLRDRLAARLETHPVDGTPEQMRERFAELVGCGPKGVPCVLNGVSCVRHGKGPPILWLHGGGYVFGSPSTHARSAATLAGLAGAAVTLPHYRLAPENPWPTALEDVMAVLDSFREPVTLVGDSAGGHLALSLALRFPDRVNALALISPNTDRSGQSQTRRPNTPRDLMNSDSDDARLADMVMSHLAPTHPDVSPILADLSRLPRTFVTAATNEVLLDDARLLIGALQSAGVAVETDILPGLWHMWPLWPGELPEADATLQSIANFSRSCRRL